MQFKNIVENKKTDGTTVKQKKDCWDEITQKYNSSAQTGPRTAKHALYDTIKKKARRNLHDDKKNLYATGGGTFIPQSDELDKKVLTILKPQYEPLSNPFDSSASYFKENVPPNETEEIIQIIGEEMSSHNIVQFSTVSDFSSISSEVAEHTVVSVSSPLPPIDVSITPSTSKNVKTPARKRKSENIEILTKRIVDRKNLKDKLSADVQEKKEKILEVERTVKEKHLQIAEIDLQIKEKDLELKIQELQHKKKLQEIELEIKSKELEIINWEHSLKSLEYDSHLEMIE